MVKTRHIPLRNCVVCGRRASKRELLRIVATSLGEIRLDSAGKVEGRGTYVCSENCSVVSVLDRKRLEYALRVKIDDSQWTDLLSSFDVVMSGVNNCGRNEL